MMLDELVDEQVLSGWNNKLCVTTAPRYPTSRYSGNLPGLESYLLVTCCERSRNELQTNELIYQGLPTGLSCLAQML